MTFKQRRILFFICFGLFLLAAPIVILYSQGYRFDFSKKRFELTGAFFLKVKPRSYSVYLDNKKARQKTDLFGATLIDGLLPKQYQLAVKKDNYFNWTKNLFAGNDKVIEAKNIVIFPEKITVSILETTAEKFFVSPDQKKAVCQSDNVLKFYNLSANDSYSSDQETNGQENLSIDKTIFSDDSRRALIEATINDKKEYFFADFPLANTPENNSVRITLLPQSLSFFLKDAIDVSFSPNSREEIIFLKNGSLWAGNVQENNLTLKIAGATAYFIYKKDIYYLDGQGFIFKTNNGFSYSEKINRAAFPSKQGSFYRLMVFNEKIFLKEDDCLYFLDQKNNSFEKLIESVKFVSAAKDGKKIAIGLWSEIWLFYLENEENQPQRKTNELVFLNRFSENIGGLSWLNDHYLIFSLKGKPTISEIDNRDRLNVCQPAFIDSQNNQLETEKIDFLWNSVSRRIYFFYENAVYRSNPVF